MSKNYVIGQDGKLPWDLPTERKHFVRMTTDKVLIIGRKTFEERPSRSHIRHCAHCIVVSKSMPETTADDGEHSPPVTVARSFPEALQLAREIIEEIDSRGSSCWVAGGARLYHEALLHPSSTALVLSVVDTQVPDKHSNGSHLDVVRFPQKYRWDNKYREESRQDVSDDGINFSIHTFQRLKGLR